MKEEMSEERVGQEPAMTEFIELPISQIEEVEGIGRDHRGRDPRWVETLRLLYATGAPFSPITVYEKSRNPSLPQGRDPKKPFVVVNGKYRLAALNLMRTEDSTPTVVAEITEYESCLDSALIGSVSDPFHARPLTLEELAFAGVQMLEHGGNIGNIRHSMAVLFPPKFIDEVINRALAAWNSSR